MRRGPGHRREAQTLSGAICAGDRCERPPPEVVFAYFADPARMVNWMGVAALLDPGPGGTFRVEANGRDVVIGEYVEVDPPNRIVFTWGFEGTDPFVAPGSTRVEVTLERDGDETLLTLFHHGLADGARDAHAADRPHSHARQPAPAQAAAAGGLTRSRASSRVIWRLPQRVASA